MRTLLLALVVIALIDKDSLVVYRQTEGKIENASKIQENYGGKLREGEKSDSVRLINEQTSNENKNCARFVGSQAGAKDFHL